MIFLHKEIEKLGKKNCVTEIIELSQKYDIDKIFIIVITSFGTKSEIQRIKNIKGIDEVIEKPINYDIIKKVFNKFNKLK